MISMNEHDTRISLRGKNVLVTGAAGFIGSNLVPELLRRNNRVVCLVRPGEELAMYLKYRYWRFDTSKAKRDFGFQSRYPLEKGVQITIDWYRRNGHI